VDCRDLRAQKERPLMNPIRNHRDLEAWQIAMDLTTETYRLTEAFPAKETYGLQSQMRRAAVSVPSNIAEGQARAGRAAINHLAIAGGSLAELDTQTEVAIRLKYLAEEAVVEFRRLCESSRRLVFGLKRSKRDRLLRETATKTGVLLLLFYALSRVVS
jgi:four helix bundle protein